MKPTIDWSNLSYSGFAKLAGDTRLSKYEKIGFPDAYRDGFEAAIFEDIVRKLPLLAERQKTVVDVGPGCSDLPAMMMQLCAEHGHDLNLIDSPEMLSQLPDRTFVRKIPGMFPNCRNLVADLDGRVHVLLCYSVLHYIFVEANVFEFVDAVIELLAPGGAALVGDIPNVSKRRRFFRSEAGVAFHRSFTGTDGLPEIENDVPVPRLIDDSVVLALLLRARAAGVDAYIVPQSAGLPMANRREDILLRKPG